MSVELHPAFSPRVPGLLYQAEGKALIDRLKALHRLAGQCGVAPLTAFMDNREAPDDDVDFDARQASWDEWFAPADGLRTVEGLLDAVRSPPSQGKPVKDAETVLHDLEELARCLRAAVAHGARFRLEVR